MCEWIRSIFGGRVTRPIGAMTALSVLVLALGGCQTPPEAEVTSLEPNHGPASGGTQVTILGNTLGVPLAVTFNDVAATNLQLIHSHALTVTTPPGVPGPATLMLLFADGSLVVIPDAFTYDEEPLSAARRPLSITHIEPDSGSTAGGTALTIKGTNFVPESVLLIGGQPAQNLTYLGESLLTATTPPGTEGVANVVLNTGEGRSATYPPGFTYVAQDSYRTAPASLFITAVEPRLGPHYGGTMVTVQGSGFEEGAVVVFNETLAPVTTFVNRTYLTAVTPPHEAGVVDVSVVLSDGARATLADGYEFLPPTSPKIRSISPAQGPCAGGTAVAITGNGFRPDTQVYFGLDCAPSVEVFSEQALAAITPPHVSGDVDVTIRNPNGEEDISYQAFCYVDLEAPAIHTIEPDYGPAAGGTLVTITGSNFRPEVAVLFDGIAASSVTFINSATVTAVTPPNEPGWAELTLINGDGKRVSEPTGFEYLAPVPLEIYSFDPDTGPTAGGTVVTILGQGFAPGAAVLFGSLLASDVNVVSSEIITAVSPPREGCPLVTLTVTLPDGQSFTTDDWFEYEAARPSISSISPPSGPEGGGTVVLITGTNLGSVESITFDWDAAEHFAVLSDTLIQAVTPPGYGAAVVRISGECDEVGYALFEYVPPDVATIGGISPDRGPEAGGTVVTITGTGLAETDDVYFGDYPAETFSVLSDTLLQAVSPRGSGIVEVEVCTPNGTPEALFTYIPPDVPAISSIEPDCGPAAGGTVVTICGCNLTCISAVKFDWQHAAEMVVLCDDCIQVVAPPGTPGRTVVVTIETCNGWAEGLYTYLLPDAPAVTYVTPSCGPEEGGTPVLIGGCGFTEAANVTFAHERADFAIINDEQIIAWAPPGEGTVPLVVATPYGSAAALFTYIPAGTASIAGIAPDSGPEAGRTIVTITGTALGETTDVLFDDVQALAFTILSDTMLQAVTPPGTGVAVVVVETPYGNPEALFTYVPPGTPTISGLTPPCGPEDGGTVVTISGTGLAAADRVTFGGVGARRFALLSDSLIQAETPAGFGTVTVRVETPTGDAYALFTYVPPGVPTIGSVYPDRGPEAGGTVVTITGTGFTETRSVYFGDYPAEMFTVLSDTLLQAVTPSGAGTVRVEVCTADASAEALYTYIPPELPAISTIEPACGPAGGGTVVTICGCNLTCVVDVYFGWQWVTGHIVELSDDCIQVVAPPNTPGTTVLVEVETCHGIAEGLYTYLFPDAPAITSVTPAYGPEEGGTAVVISGYGFTGAEDVIFGWEPADFIVISDTQIVAWSPPGVGTLPLVVKTPTGDAAALFTYHLPEVPPRTAITSLTPSSGPAEGGTPVVIEGIGFHGTSVVNFGPRPAYFEVISDTQIVASSPPGSVGPAAVVVVSSSGAAAAIYTYTP